jgi:TrmH family RNA methyltransferase
LKRIVSADNARYRALQKLAESSRERKKHGLSLLDGVHLVSAYREHVGLPSQLVVSASGLNNREVQALIAAIAPVEPLLLSDALFNQLSTVATPTGIMAAVETPRPPQVPAHLAACVMLEDIQDPGNLGSILRSAAAAGMRDVFLSHGSVHAWSPRVLRAGMGAHFMLRIHEQCDLPVLARGFDGRVIATSHHSTQPVFSVDLAGHVALVFGNEGAGVSAEMRATAHAVVSIPMPGPAESLNIAAAAAVCLFERVRQQRAAGRVQ